MIQINFKPLKRLGQNFLVNQSIVKKLVDSANIAQDDTILEIGPGTGVLTKALAEKAKRVVAVEKDPRMVEILKEKFKEIENVEIIRADILKTDIARFKIQDSRFKIVANLPFYAATAIIRQFLEAENQPTEMTLLAQKEVAQRICSRPPKMNLLAVAVQVYSQPKIISYVSRTAFRPQPKVDGAIINLKTIGPRLTRLGRESSKFKVDENERKLFFKIVKAGFSQPRKQLLNTLSGGLRMEKTAVAVWLAKNGIDPKQRAETLSVENWLNLTMSF